MSKSSRVMRRLLPDPVLDGIFERLPSAPPKAK
jgi:hypothetical protein